MQKSGILLMITMGLTAGCSDRNDADGIDAERVGDPCVSAQDCYRDMDTEELQGDVVCMDRVPDGYCTHTCVTDEDCCAVPGECRTGLIQVCTPLESTSDRYCMVTCEEQEEGNIYCQTQVHPSFGCRSSGGGSANRKLCLP